VKPRKLYLDIETSPSKGYFFDLWKEDNIVEIIEEWYLLCIGYQWEGEKTKCIALPDFKGYKPGSGDYKLAKFAWELLNEADIVVADNGDAFDIPKLYARFAFHKFPPPKPFRTIDTLKIARSKFEFTSNRLDALAKHFGYGGKEVHTGKHMWLGCMNGNMTDWKNMKKYNIRDVDLLKLVEQHLLPYATNPPNIAVLMNLSDGCPACGSRNIQKRGMGATNTGLFQRYQCMDCTAWSKGKHTKVTNIK